MKKIQLVVFWDPFAADAAPPRAELFAGMFASCSSIISVDLKNESGPFARRMLGSADLAVVFLRQNERQINDFFIFYPFRKGNFLYCIYDYFEEAFPNRQQMLRLYRIAPERLCQLPFNSRLSLVCEKGHLGAYLRQEERRLPYEQLTGFYPSLREAQEKIWLALSGR